MRIERERERDKEREIKRERERDDLSLFIPVKYTFEHTVNI